MFGNSSGAWFSERLGDVMSADAVSILNQHFIEVIQIELTSSMFWWQWHRSAYTWQTFSHCRALTTRNTWRYVNNVDVVRCYHMKSVRPKCLSLLSITRNTELAHGRFLPRRMNALTPLSSFSIFSIAPENIWSKSSSVSLPAHTSWKKTIPQPAMNKSKGQKRRKKLEVDRGKITSTERFESSEISDSQNGWCEQYLIQSLRLELDFFVAENSDDLWTNKQRIANATNMIIIAYRTLPRLT